MSNNSDMIRVIQVPTIRHQQKQPKVINTKKLDEDELKLLEKEDPFLYYSIPAVKKAKLTHNKPIDHTEVLREAARSSGNSMVSRQTRVSTESAMLLDELMLQIDEEDVIDYTEVIRESAMSMSSGTSMVSRMLKRKCAPYQCCMMI